MKIHSIYDNGGTSVDRYTVYYKGRGALDPRTRLRDCLGMSGRPFHHLGVCLHDQGRPGRHNGKMIKFEQLPPDCQRAVINDLTPDLYKRKEVK